MGVFEHFPQTNFHDLNLDWILKTVAKNAKTLLKLSEDFDDLKEWCIGQGLSDSVISQLEIWKNDNTLATIINNAIMTEKMNISDYDTKNPANSNTVDHSLLSDVSLKSEDVSANSVLDALTGYVVPEQFTADNDSDAIQQAIDFAQSSGKTLALKPGKVYNLTKKLYITSPLKIDGRGATLKVLYNDFAIDINVPVVTSSKLQKPCFIKNLYIDANSMGGGFCLTNASRWCFSNIFVWDCPTIAFKHVKGFEVFVNNASFKGTDLSTQSIGIYTLTSDSHYTDIAMVDMHTAIRHGVGGPNYFTRIHPWIATPGLLPDSCFLFCEGNCIAMFEDCYMDTFHKGIIYASTSGCRLHFHNTRFAINQDIWSLNPNLANVPLYLGYYNSITNDSWEYKTTFTGFSSNVGSLTFNCSNLTRQMFQFDNSTDTVFSDVGKANIITVPLTLPSSIHDVIGNAEAIIKNGWCKIHFHGQYLYKSASPTVTITLTHPLVQSLKSVPFPIFYGTTDPWTRNQVATGYASFGQDPYNINTLTITCYFSGHDIPDDTNVYFSFDFIIAPEAIKT